VADCAGNLPLVTLMNSLADLTLEIVTAIDTPRSAKEGICRFHRAIFEAIERHDEDAAHDLMREHIGEVQADIGQTIEQTLQDGSAVPDLPAAGSFPRSSRS
jgi:GntR family transcriptional repressor for pyruvate dehydrogenase complex